jgi:hypothetical protein
VEVLVDPVQHPLVSTPDVPASKKKGAVYFGKSWGALSAVEGKGTEDEWEFVVRVTSNLERNFEVAVPEEE